MNEIIATITDENYFDFPALSASGINGYFEHPAIFWASSALNPLYEPSEKTEAMIFGTLLHAMLLEGNDKVEELFVVNDENRNSTKFKEFATEINGTKQIIKTPALDKAKGIIEFLRKDEDAVALLKGCKYEAPFTSIKNGMPVKGKIDAFKTEGHLIVDYKSTEDTSRDELNKTITNRGYHRCAAWYMDLYELVRGIRPRGFVCLFQNKSYPQIITPLNISADAIELGAFENEIALKDIKRRIEYDYWKTTKGVLESETPTWYKAQGIHVEDEWSELIRRGAFNIKQVEHVGQ